MLSWTRVVDVTRPPTVVGEGEEVEVGGEDGGVEVLW